MNNTLMNLWALLVWFYHRPAKAGGFFGTLWLPKDVAIAMYERLKDENKMWRDVPLPRNRGDEVLLPGGAKFGRCRKGYPTHTRNQNTFYVFAYSPAEVVRLAQALNLLIYKEGQPLLTQTLDPNAKSDL